MNTRQARFNMIEQQIRPWDVLDPEVLKLLAQVRREDFVPAAYKSLAFMDVEVPLPKGQCMLTPRVEARILQALALRGREQVLEVGAGSGFMAALLAHRARMVTTLEIEPELAALAARNLRQAGLDNVAVVEADGRNGRAVAGPFDAIVLSGAVAELPHTLLDQLAVGGRLVAIEGDEPAMRATLYQRETPERMHSQVLFETVAPRLIGFEPASRFRF